MLRMPFGQSEKENVIVEVNGKVLYMSCVDFSILINMY